MGDWLSHSIWNVGVTWENFKEIILLLSIIIGLDDKVWGQMGINITAFTDGFRIGPPAEREYAVDPVGVAIRL